MFVMGMRWGVLVYIFMRYFCCTKCVRIIFSVREVGFLESFFVCIIYYGKDRIVLRVCVF